MPKLKRVHRASDETWQQLELRLTFPEQRVYELIRPVVLYSQSPAQRAGETGTPERTLYRQVERFRQGGMRGLCPPDTLQPPNTLPADLKALILDLKVEHPPLRVNQIATICYARTGRRPDDKTIKRVLTENELPHRPSRRFPLYHQITDPAERRATIIRLHFEGWGKKAISAYLQCHRDTVHATLRRWATEGLGGVYNKSRAPLRRVRKVNLKVMDAVRRLQRNPLLGEFRVSAALKQQLGLKISPRTCGRILALNRRLYADLRNESPPREKKTMPFQAARRHHYWSVDIRYLTKKEQTVPGVDVAYSITILENYSRTILASVLSRSQDLSAYLLVLFTAISHYGAPEAIVSDGGAVFKANQAQDIYHALGIQHERIENRQSWQNYSETTFNVQRRMADWAFGQATTWAELVAAHEQWVLDFNCQPHWAHRQRDDNRHSPIEVLDWVRGRICDEDRLHHIFHTTRFDRRLDRAGYVQFRRWKMYGEMGLALRRAVIWLTAENVTITFQEQPLAHYAVNRSADQKRLTDIREPQLVETAFRSPQLPLWELSDAEWRKVVPPKQLQPLSLWERGADGVVQIVPMAPVSRRKQAVSPLIQAAFALELSQ
jgi:putative transposase